MAPLSKADSVAYLQSAAADDDSTFESENLAIYDQQSKRKVSPRRSSLVTPETKKARSGPSRKSVQWAEYADQVEIPNDLTEQEKADGWFDDEEYKRIARDNHYTVQAMNGGVFPDTEDETFRGLENHMYSYRMERNYNVETAVQSILKEQERLGFLLDPIWIDHVYSKFTARSMIFAERAGRFDARAIAMYR